MINFTSHTHDQLVELTAVHMSNQGFNRVQASHIDRFTACDKIGNYIPDVTALSEGVFVVIEAESREGLALAHTEAQWKTFHNHASRLDGHFIAVVNKSDEAVARALLTQVCGKAANAHVWTF